MSTIILAIRTEVFYTSIALSKGENIVYQSDIDHSRDDFILMDEVVDQLPFRRDAIMNRLRQDAVDIKSIEYVVAEGGLLKPCESGVYEIDKIMVGDMIDGVGGDDVINMAGLLAFTIANTLRVKSLVVDPASVDERSEIASFFTHPITRKKSLFHALVHKYLSNKYARSLNKKYEDMNIIFCHVGDRNVSVAAHKKGLVVDVNQAYMGFGPMGFFETGTMPVSNVMDMLLKKHYTKEEMLKLVNRNATFNYYIHTNSCDEIMSSHKDNRTDTILDVMSYQIAKEIASHYVTLEGKIDAIILSGKIFSDKRFFKYLSTRIEDIAPIASYPKDYTIEAMVYNVLQTVKGEKKVKTYD
ncbi:MAG: butyrate kinase [Bacteroidales bacterium]|nr:butyrate kinase [Bacteroidales bacterium]